MIKKDIKAWAEKYQIPHRTKIYKYTYRLCLPNDKDYTQFALTWNPQYSVSANFVFKNPK